MVVVVRSTTEEEEEIDEGGYLGCDDAEDGGGGSLGPANVEEEEWEKERGSVKDEGREVLTSPDDGEEVRGWLDPDKEQEGGG